MCLFVRVPASASVHACVYMKRPEKPKPAFSFIKFTSAEDDCRISLGSLATVCNDECGSWFASDSCNAGRER